MPINNGPTDSKKTGKSTVPAAEFKSPSLANEDDIHPDDAAVDDGPASDVFAPTVKPDESTVKPVEDEYAYVQMPDGSYRAIRKADIQRINNITDATGKPEIPVQDVYVWLADGSVERVSEDELPGAAGTNAAHGHYVRDGHTFLIVAVYPVETENPKG